MANDNRASFFCIGLTVIAGVAAIVAALIYLGGIKDSASEYLVETYSDKPVSGLSVGSSVNLRGVKIGEVREVGFIGNKYKVEGPENGRIYILMALNKNLLGDVGSDAELEALLRAFIAMGLRATVSSSGITGIAKMEVDYYPDDKSPVEISWTPRHVLIPPRVSLLESFSDSATKVMNQINKMDLNAFWSNINATVESVSAMTLSSQHLLESYQPELERMIKNLEEASVAIRGFAEDLRRNPSSVLRGREESPLPETER